ncbi:hypothetical protein [Dyella terrae]|uniref:hypothetical protein n=1 Tax=Dyella terrae TaxID=522259 RepID=UPI001EFD3463|nr:hypothetical protein [Dyella terrae]ULU26872.1 hypothetical protein DYST_03821 [Dyella terrae]
MKAKRGILALSAIVTACLFGQAYAAHPPKSNQTTGVFLQCSTCVVSGQTPALLSYVQSAISLYNGSTLAASNGHQVSVGDEIQIERRTTKPNGAWSITDHYFVVAHLPVTSFNDLIDQGMETDSDGGNAFPPPTGPNIGAYVAQFAADGGSVVVYYGYYPPG